MRETTRVLVVDDDADALLLRLILGSRPGYEVVFCRTPAQALAVAARRRFDVLVTDLHMPGMDGLELAAALRETDPTLPVLLVTAHATIDAAVRAVKGSVTDFLTTPLHPDAVCAAIDAAAHARRCSGRRILAIGAHPDDVEIGAGATLAQHVRAGDRVTVLTASRGREGGDPGLRRAEAHEAADRLGARLVLGDLEDAAIPDRGPTITLIESVIDEVRPDIVYVHSAHDVHQDHRAVHAATLVAARAVARVLCYQSPSATVDFRPSTFVSAEAGLETKLDALAAFETQTALRDHLSPEALTATARYWGRIAHIRYAEPFEVVRSSLEVDRVLV
jgi:LmbE family N-acetylglucosaminyl deacetylase/CheY-like chemotaxis protein